MFSFHPTDGVPLKLWDSAMPFEDSAMQQLRNVARLPFVHSHIAGMPDVHWGLGATVGSVMATKGVSHRHVLFRSEQSCANSSQRPAAVPMRSSSIWRADGH